MQTLKALPPFYSSGTVAQDLPRTLSSPAAEPAVKLRGVAPMPCSLVLALHEHLLNLTSYLSGCSALPASEDCFVPGQKNQKAYLAWLISVSKQQKPKMRRKKKSV